LYLLDWIGIKHLQHWLLSFWCHATEIVTRLVGTCVLSLKLGFFVIGSMILHCPYYWTHHTKFSTWCDWHCLFSIKTNAI